MTDTVFHEAFPLPGDDGDGYLQLRVVPGGVQLVASAERNGDVQLTLPVDVSGRLIAALQEATHLATDAPTPRFTWGASVVVAGTESACVVGLGLVINETGEPSYRYSVEFSDGRTTEVDEDQLAAHDE